MYKTDKIGISLTRLYVSGYTVEDAATAIVRLHKIQFSEAYKKAFDFYKQADKG